ncbi:MAG TPA: hypothetical protein VKX25_21980 [Bryobacteraceae bacterium]|nr:hypothetical protein [Bryobacteraceae bacterium]
MPPLQKRLLFTLLGVFLFALLVGVAFVHVSGGFARPLQGGGSQYVGLARSLAAGRGYLWDGAPHLGRLPLWPAVLAVPARIFPHASDGVLLRVTGVVVHAFTALLLGLLAYRLWPDLRIAALSGAFFAIYPASLALLDDGHSECAFALVAIAGLWLSLRRWPWSLAGAFLLGCSVLAYSTLIVLPFVMIAIAFARRVSICWKRVLPLAIVFFVPASCWILRNYFDSGDFPLLTAIDGEQLYGGNNPVAANDLLYWGYWVLPDEIPGQTPKRVLFAQLGEAGMNRYYLRKGFEYAKNHAREYPRLLVGKLVRGFVPVPWLPSISALLANLIRLLLYVVAVWSVFKRRITDSLFSNFLLALFLTTLANTLIYYGTFHITFCLDIFLILTAAAQAIHVSNFGRRRSMETAELTSR